MVKITTIIANICILEEKGFMITSSGSSCIRISAGDNLVTWLAPCRYVIAMPSLVTGATCCPKPWSYIAMTASFIVTIAPSTLVNTI